MNKILMTIRTLISYFCIGILGLIFGLPCFIILWLPEKYRYDNRIFYKCMDLFFKGVLKCTFLPIRIKGKKNISNIPVIIAANHQSSLDIPIVGSLCNAYPHVWLVLEYYVDYPLLGHFIKRMFVAVDQTSPSKAARSLIQIMRMVKDQKRHLIIFPEGGRYIDGEIHPFFEGFAVIAKKTGRPVVPVYMANNRIIYPPHSFMIYPYPIEVVVGEPIQYLENDTDASFTERVRNWFVDQAKAKQ